MRVLPRRELSAEVWKLAGPVVIGMVSQTLLNVVDTAMVGRLGAVALGAAGLGGVLSWMVLGAFGALNTGTQAVAARRFGEKEMEATGLGALTFIGIGLRSKWRREFSLYAFSTTNRMEFLYFVKRLKFQDE